MPGGFNPNAAYQQIGTDTGQIIYLQGGTYFDINGNVIFAPLVSNGPSKNVQSVAELNAQSGAKVMVNGDVIFTSVGDCQILNLMSECVTANDGTLSTLQYSIVTVISGATTTISGASSSLASLQPDALIILPGGSLATAATVNVNGVGIGTTQAGVTYPEGSIKLIIGVGPTTGTWKHYVRYRPLDIGAFITPNQ